MNRDPSNHDHPGWTAPVDVTKIPIERIKYSFSELMKNKKRRRYFFVIVTSIIVFFGIVVAMIAIVNANMFISILTAITAVGSILQGLSKFMDDGIPTLVKGATFLWKWLNKIIK